ncbi:unnamed protein product [Protopolystoma xenopodis]|uniref:Uncharacterized protein n=1 Tax=Protopolystoma xenopodis TaxID=117903 RepID=A0A448XIZ6_9PLAT|nr:unnamed protein product [Protopolystoma xenopodis]
MSYKTFQTSLNRSKGGATSSAGESSTNHNLGPSVSSASPQRASMSNNLSWQRSRQLSPVRANASAGPTGGPGANTNINSGSSRRLQLPPIACHSKPVGGPTTGLAASSSVDGLRIGASRQKVGGTKG